MVMLMEGNRLKAADVKTGDFVKFLTEGDWVKDSFKQADGTSKESNAFVVSVEFNGQAKDLKLTKASRENLKETFGPDTTKWIGSQASITLVPTEKGKSIMLSPVVWKD